MTDWRDNVTWYTHDTPFGKFVKAVLLLLSAILARVTVEGSENVPPNSPCVIVANHLSLFDIIYLGINLPTIPHFMAKKELFKNPVLGWMIRAGGSFPVNRGEGDAWALAQAGRVLDEGAILFMFPEGTRSKGDSALKRGKVGAVKLALEHQVPVVPAAIWGTEIFKIGVRRNNITIRFGQPVDVVTLAGPLPYKHEIYRELTTTVMEKIAAMLPPQYRGFYADSVADDA
jgi:1-acyl-sn-glycerol-3-phosphate acyltransferase